MTEKLQRQNAVIYCRVSTKQQEIKGDGLRSQLTRCAGWAEHRDYEIIEVFNDKLTGKSDDRPGMLALLKFIKAQKTPTVVIVDDISRLARDVDVHRMFRRKIISAGGILQSPSFEFKDNDPHSKFVETIQAGKAELDREQNRLQVINRQMARMQSGYWVFYPPTGYKYVANRGRGKVLVRNEPFASTVVEIYEGFAAGRFETLAEVQRYLKSHPAWPASQRASITGERVKELLTRPHYAGYIHYPAWGLSLIPAQHEPLISFKTYQAVQDRLSSKAKAPARKGITDQFALKGFVLCGDCEHPMSACWSKGRHSHYPYYLCYTKGCVSYGRSVRQELIEGQFEELLQQLRPTASLIKAAGFVLKRIWEHRVASAKEHAKRLESEIKKIDQAIDQFLERIVETNSKTVIGAYESKITSLQAERLEIAETMAKWKRPMSDFDSSFRTALDFLANPYKLWVSEAFEDKRAVLKLAFQRRLAYVRGSGFRTAELTAPFKLINGLSNDTVSKREMVDAAGIEPATLRV